MEYQKLTIAILTYKRPEELRLGLPVTLEHVSNLNQDVDHGIVARVLVIDNDPAGSAETVVRAFNSEFVRYVIEPEPGISAGRNRALDEGSDSDLLAFIDDDERPRDSWLKPLIQTWRQTGAAAVMGRVVSEFENELDPWIAAGRFFSRRRMNTGMDIQVAAAGNLLLDMTQIRNLGVRFHTKFGLTGGEDTLFSRMLTDRGGKIVWCDESVATDFVPATRLTRRWVLARSWSHGNSATLVELYLAKGARQELALRCKATCRGLLRVSGGCSRYLYGVIVRSLQHRARGLRTAFRGAGMIAGAVGLAYQEYARAEQTGLGTASRPILAKSPEGRCESHATD